MSFIKKELDQKISFDAFKKQVLQDYKTIVESRECAILGRREVLSGKGNFAKVVQTISKPCGFHKG